MTQIIRINSSYKISSYQQWLIICAVTLRFFMGGVDSSILPLGISSIAMEFGGELASFLFLVEGILFASALVFSGRLGDQVGLKTVFLVGIGLCTLGSLLSSMAVSMEWLLFFRFISSIGLTLSLAVALPIITVFVSEENRGRSIGYTIMGMSVGSIAGPIICGFILENLGWKEMYLLLVPIGIIIFIIGFFSIPRTSSKTTHMVYDYPGFFLIFLTLGLFCIGMNLGLLNQDPLFFAEAMCVSLIAGILFVVWEKKTEFPLIDLSFLMQKSIFIPLFIVFSIYCIYRMSFYFLPIYLSEILKITTITAGFIMSIGAIIPAIGSPVTGYYIETAGIQGIKKLLLISGTFGILTSFCMIGTPWIGAITAVYISLFFLGIMFSIGYTAIYGYYYSQVPSDHAGMAGGIIETTVEFSALMAISFVQIFFSAGVFFKTGGTISARDIIWQAVPGVQVMYLFSFLLCIGVIYLSFKLPAETGKPGA